MKKALLLAGICAVEAALGQTKDYPVQSVNFTAVKLTDSFWLPRLRTNHLVTIPASFERCESTGRVANFEKASTHSGKFGTIFPFDDTDIYKTIEGASFSLSIFPDKKLEVYIDTLIEKIRKAQEPDGYLYTARTIDPAHPHAWSGPERWVKERELSLAQRDCDGQSRFCESSVESNHQVGGARCLDRPKRTHHGACSADEKGGSQSADTNAVARITDRRVTR